MRKKQKQTWTDHFRKAKNKLEWFVFFLAAVLLLCTAVYLIAIWSTNEKPVAELSLYWQQTESPKGPGSFRLRATNSGNKTAESVYITAERWHGSVRKDVLISIVQILPRHSSKELWMHFQQYAPGDSVVFWISSYQ